MKDYLEALEPNRPRRGRQRTPDSIKKRLATIESQLPERPPLQRLAARPGASATSRASSSDSSATVDLSGLEAEFVKVAKPTASARASPTPTWRELGVAADVLKKAGISRAG